MGFASFKIVCIFIISDVSAKAQGKTQIAAKSLSQGSFQLHILLPCRRLPGRGQELLHVPAHGGVVLLLPPRLLTLGGQRRPPGGERVHFRLHPLRGRQGHGAQTLALPGGGLKENDLPLIAPQELLLVLRRLIAVIDGLELTVGGDVLYFQRQLLRYAPYRRVGSCAIFSSMSRFSSSVT